MDIDTAIERLRGVTGDRPGLRLLLVHGSRAEGHQYGGSDWDLAYLADAGLDPMALLADVTSVLGTDRVDLTDLAATSGLLRFRAARSGIPVYENPLGAHEEFVLEAALFWCDARPVIEAAHRQVLAELG